MKNILEDFANSATTLNYQANTINLAISLKNLHTCSKVRKVPVSEMHCSSHGSRKLLSSNRRIINRFSSFYDSCKQKHKCSWKHGAFYRIIGERSFRKSLNH